MPLTLRECVPSEEFKENFLNADFLHKTLLCFGLKTDNRESWDLWGFAYNNPGREHAESLVLKELQQYVNENIPNLGVIFKVTFYISYSPCSNCCQEISEFISKNGEKIELDINYANIYKEYDKTNQVALEGLAKPGISIEKMDKTDYEECFKLFVDPNASVLPWSVSELISKKCTEGLPVQLTEGENSCNGSNLNETNDQPSGSVAPPPPCETGDKAERTPSRNPECTQLAKREGDSGPETPQKPSPDGNRVQPTAGVKRKLVLPDEEPRNVEKKNSFL
ncbi:DNA dC-_dU-editing enzyme APOBEC-3C-like [Lissotriton helveticus]